MSLGTKAPEGGGDGISGGISQWMSVLEGVKGFVKRGSKVVSKRCISCHAMSYRAILRHGHGTDLLR